MKVSAIIMRCFFLLSILLIGSITADAQKLRLRQFEKAPDSLATIRTGGDSIQYYVKDTMYLADDTLYLDALFYPDSNIVNIHKVRMEGGGGGGCIDTAYVTSDSLYIICATDTTNAGSIRLQSNTQRLIGRVSPGFGPVQEIQIIPPIALSGNILNIRAPNNRILGRHQFGEGTVGTIWLGDGLTLSNDTLNASGGGSACIDTAFILSDTLYVVCAPDTINAGYLASGGSGTVTSVGLTLPTGEFTVTGSPVTTSGTLSVTYKTQAANEIFAGPSTGSAAVPEFRTLVVDDIPGLPGTKIISDWDSFISSDSNNDLTTGADNKLYFQQTAGGGGTVTSVGVTSTDLSVSGSPVTSSGNITLNINNSAVTTTKLANEAVTYAKFQNINAQRLLGRFSALSGTMQEITVGSGLNLTSGGVLEATAGGGGTVTSVGLSLPAGLFSVSGSPVTTSGTLTGSLTNQSAFTVFARASGTGQPSFIGLVSDHIPNLTATSKINMNTSRLLGRTSAGFGLAQEITIGSGLSLSGGTLSATGGTGTVTSVGISVPSYMSVTSSPVTTTGTMNIFYNVQNAGTFFAGPTGGSPAAPTFRSLANSDIGVGIISLNKLQSIANNTILGRHSVGTGTVETITLGTGLSLSGSTLNATGASNWTLSSGVLYPNSTVTNVSIGKTGQFDSALKLEVEGKTYLSDDTFIGGVLSLSALSRGSANVRVGTDGGIGGIGFFTQSATSHSLTSLFNNKIFGKIYPTVDGTTLTGISNSTSSSPITINGIHNNTSGPFTGGAAVTIDGAKRSGSGTTSLGSDGNVLEVSSNGSNIMSVGQQNVVILVPTRLSSWTTATRPSPPLTGYIGYNTTTNKMEAYTSSGWVDLH